MVGGKVNHDYVVTFERIGRRRNLQPATFIGVKSADALARIIYNFSKGYLASREIEVDVDLSEMKGSIYTGGRPAGNFTIKETK